MGAGKKKFLFVFSCGRTDKECTNASAVPLDGGAFHSFSLCRQPLRRTSPGTSSGLCSKPRQEAQ